MDIIRLSEKDMKKLNKYKLDKEIDNTESTLYIYHDGLLLKLFNNNDEEYLENINKISIVACGSAYHVGCVAKYFMEDILRKPVDVDVASEFRYRNPLINEKTLCIYISQSGETADTIAALKLAKSKKAKTLYS